jgi:hypothetical protein
MPHASPPTIACRLEVITVRLLGPDAPLRLACALVILVAERYPDRSVHLVADVLAAFRRALIAAGYRAGQPLQPTSTVILGVQAAWAAAGL